jgi:hypothetical protein
MHNVHGVDLGAPAASLYVPQARVRDVNLDTTPYGLLKQRLTCVNDCD